jgi:hypothetical protein
MHRERAHEDTRRESSGVAAVPGTPVLATVGLVAQRPLVHVSRFVASPISSRRVPTFMMPLFVCRTKGSNAPFWWAFVPWTGAPRLLGLASFWPHVDYRL